MYGFYLYAGGWYRVVACDAGDCLCAGDRQHRRGRGRVATFLQPALSGEVTAAIVYQPGLAASESEARTIERALGAGLVLGALKLKPRRVPMTALGGLASHRHAL